MIDTIEIKLITPKSPVSAMLFPPWFDRFEPSSFPPGFFGSDGFGLFGSVGSESVGSVGSVGSEFIFSSTTLYWENSSPVNVSTVPSLWVTSTVMLS